MNRKRKLSRTTRKRKRYYIYI